MKAGADPKLEPAKRLVPCNQAVGDGDHASVGESTHFGIFRATPAVVVLSLEMKVSRLLCVS